MRRLTNVMGVGISATLFAAGAYVLMSIPGVAVLFGGLLGAVVALACLSAAARSAGKRLERKAPAQESQGFGHYDLVAGH